MHLFAMIVGALLHAVSALRRKDGANSVPVVNGPMTDGEFEYVNQQAAASCPGATNWHKSIVDYLKIFGLPSSLAARRELAAEYGYSGKAAPGSAEWNEWLLAETMNRVRDGRIVPAGLDDDE